jgi:undecaprenyl-diphosphatase
LRPVEHYDIEAAVIVMDFMDFGCPVLRARYFELFMAVVGYYGHGALGSAVGLLLLAHGYTYDNQRTKRAGIAVLAALMISGLAAELLKHFIRLQIPRLRTSSGFPSGHASAGFALGSVLAAAFPALGPVFYMLAVLSAVSRLYFRSQFTWGVAGGAAIGLLTGVLVARKLIARSSSVGRGPLRFAGWLGVAAFAIAGLIFFYSIETNVRIHMIVPATGQGIPATSTFDFGAARARNFLQYGWSGDEQWLDRKQSVVWASGLASALTMELPAVQDYRFRLHVFPYSPKRTACQRIEVRLNNILVSKIFLERGWHSYEFNVPSNAIRAGKNDVQFFYDYAESPKSRERSSDERALSVAFDTLEVFPVR